MLKGISFPISVVELRGMKVVDPWDGYKIVASKPLKIFVCYEGSILSF